MNKVQPILQPSIRFLVQAMCQSCLLTSLSVTALRLLSPSHMKLKLGSMTLFMAVFLISLLSNNRFYDHPYRLSDVVNLQAQLASLKAQAAQSIANGSVTANPIDKYHGKLHNLQDVQTWCHPNDSSMAPNFNPNLSTSSYGLSDRTSSLGNFENSVISSGSDDYVSFNTNFEDAPRSMSPFDMQTHNRQWTNFQDVDDLQAMALGYAQHS
ncbi:hypothetical protein Goarm_010837 [Gossypium armourianum]|uniref:Uncharacterized protein n=1 Tax=Gossypium armourianum TaxID=34283 RepID=A0A7J9IWI3_9ROSI|nr:hypothetical protein [Gossypium armourianum]